MASVRPYYDKAWPPIVHGASLWLHSQNVGTDEEQTSTDDKHPEEDHLVKHIHLIMGNCYRTHSCIQCDT